MRLERLEISGFKSFSDRSELSFDRGVTAIVGPNGCGKSNVADAITWVLGEQSARSLRGEKMEDVIFSGSDARRPTGTAEVRLRLSGVTSLPTANGNGNGHEPGHAPEATPAGDVLDEFRPAGRDVELTRRLYRSGESEYLIDGEHCRLKDIHELLMDTGLGAKAYAIIEQGKIGMILSSRPTDRRQLIEEAAGITKYKARRRSAELKLEAAQQNLTRIDDIVYEVEKQRGSLKRQAAKARRYQRLREELRRWEKVLFARRYRDLREAIDGARARLLDARERETAAGARLAEVEGDIGRLRIEVAEADARATAARDRAHAHELDIQRTGQQVELNRQQMRALAARVVDLDAELQALVARRAPQQALLESRREAAAQVEVERQEAAGRLAEENEQLQLAQRGIEGLEGEVEASRGEVFSAINAATALRHAIDSAAAARERAQEGLGRVDVEDADLRVEREALARGRAEAEQGLAAAQAALAAIRAERAALEAERTAARDEHAALSAALREQEHEVASLAARLRSLEELDAGRAQFTDAARVLLAEANGSVDQRGAVADYLEVDRRYERAIETLAGDLLQHVLVPSHAHALTGVQLLRERHAGRCGFLVLDAVPPADDRPAPEGLTAARDVVRATGPYADAVAAVLSRGCIAETYERAVEAAAATGADVATLDGDLVRGGHLVVGGAGGDTRGILATKGEIKDLRARLDAGRAAADGLAARAAAASARMQDAALAIDDAGARLHAQEKDIVAFEARLARARDEASRMARKEELLVGERRRAEEEIARLEARQAEARASIAVLEARQAEADVRFNDAQRRLFEARERVEGLSARVAEAKASHAALVERESALRAEVARLEEQTRELETRVDALGAERTQKTAARDALDAETAAAVVRLDEAVAALDGLRADVRTAEDAAASLKADAERHDGLARDARVALDAVRAEAAEHEIARARAESDLEHLSAACADAVGAPLDEVLVEVEQLEREGGAVPDARVLAVDGGDDAADEAGGDEAADGTEPVAAEAAPGPAQEPRTITAEDAIAGLRSRIDRLGPVNMMAIEQYDELETRHAFLVTQRKDLVDSIAATNDAIARIDETSKTRFRDAFEAINRNFQDSFSTLFGGGRAGITLLDEADPLESGIDIVASPPGKRLQSVQLLSGGEKALTAIALMFAIFKYKPSPFCLLDEIDAPLDDANIGRFVEMLKGMLHHTQFILITHNRKTMEIADRLYGVTMEEPGVSRLISVRLS